MKRLLALICSVLLAAPTGLAADSPTLCATHRTNLTDQLNLHRKSTRAMERARGLRAFAAAERPAFAADFGNIAVMDSSGGVLAAPNPFDLNGRNLLFSREDGGLRLQESTEKYSSAEAEAGTPLALGDDDAKLVPLGFSMPFFGSYDSIWVHSDGTITFWEADAATAARSLGRLAGGPPRIAPLFADLDPTAGGSIRIFGAENYVTITWLDVPQYAASGFGPRQRFQLRLYASGSFEFLYSSITLSTAVVGFSPGRLQGPLDVVSLSESAGDLFVSGAAERFGSEESIDIVRTAQRFYQTHEDAYDYLVIFNAMGVSVAPGALANMTAVRTKVHGIGDELVDAGLSFGSPRRLQAVLNMGPNTTYPLDPYLPVGFRGRITGDNTMTLLGHETGHLFLALASVNVDGNRPMIGAQSAHWSFNFNSEASLLEGNRIDDRGPEAEFRYLTTGTVEGYSPLDQYLMGLRASWEVPPTFAVLNATAPRIGSGVGAPIPASKLPQVGVLSQGGRLDIAIDDVIAAEGRRIPDHTVAQSRFRFAFVLITPEGQEPPAAAVDQIETYRNEFELYFNRVSDGRAWADTSLRPMMKLSAWPAIGVAAGQEAPVSLEIARPVNYDLVIGLHTTHGHIEAASPVTLAAGQTRLTFNVKGLSEGVSDLVAEAWNGHYEAVFTRIDVKPSLASLTLQPYYTGGPIVLRVTDANNTPYPGVRIRISINGGSPRFVDGYNSDFVTLPDGLMWFWWDDAEPGASIDAEIDGAPETRITVKQ